MGQRHKQAKESAAAALLPRRALSPRVQPARLESGTDGTAGRAASNALTDPTAGLRGETCPHTISQEDSNGKPRNRTVRGNTMARTNMASGVRARAGSAEFAREALTRPSVQMSPPMAGRRLVPGMEEKIRHAGESAGLRQTAMSQHGAMIGNGAVGIRHEFLRRLGDDPINDRTIVLTVPVWAGEDASCPVCSDKTHTVTHPAGATRIRPAD